MGKVTKKMLEEYRKTKADIPILQAELENMRQGEAGIGTIPGRRVYPALTGLCTNGDRKPCRRNRRTVRRWNVGLKRSRTVAPVASSECITSRGLDGRKSLPSLDIMVNQIIQGYTFGTNT